MNFLSYYDQRRLDTCTEDIKLLINTVSKHRGCRVLCGRRGRKDQNAYYNQKKSKVKYPNSKHNKRPSEGVDTCPDPIPDNWGAISWKLIPKQYRERIKKEIKELCEFYNFNGYVKATADQLGIKIRQGHDWDGDNEFNDQTFDDIIHTETGD